MKRLLILLFSLFFLSSPSVFAEDISDFKIEGMSIGDSLLDYFSEKTIQDSIFHDYYKKFKEGNKFVRVEFWKLDMEIYDVLSAHIKPNDKNYIIYELSGAILFEENVSDCDFEQNKVENELNLLFDNTQKVDSGWRFHYGDDTGQSTYHRVDFYFPTGNSINITCYDWSLAKGYSDHLNVGLTAKELSSWLTSLER